MGQHRIDESHPGADSNPANAREEVDVQYKECGFEEQQGPWSEDDNRIRRTCHVRIQCLGDRDVPDMATEDTLYHG